MTDAGPPDGWSEPERRLWRACQTGAWCDFREPTDQPGDGVEWGAHRRIRAVVLEHLLLGGATVAAGDAAAEVAAPTGRVVKVRLAGARITGQLDLRDADLDMPVLLVDCWFDESVMLSGASLRGLILDRSALAGLAVQDAQVAGSLLLRRIRARGPVRLRGVRVGGSLDLTGATLADPGAEPLAADNATVGGSLLAGGAQLTGRTSMYGARIGGDLVLDGATLTNPGGTALVFVEAEVRRLRLHLTAGSAGTVALNDTRIGRLFLAPVDWPPDCRIELDGFSVERIVAPRPWPAAERVAWFERHTGRYAPSVYEQLAAGYRREGHEADARAVLRAKELRRHRQLHPLGRLWGVVQHATVGFGYAPGRALLWLAILLSAGTAYFAGNRLAAVTPGEAPTWNPFVYTLDVIVPLVDFGHERAYDPTGADQVVTLLLAALGWVLAAAVVAGAGRTLKRP